MQGVSYSKISFKVESIPLTCSLFNTYIKSTPKLTSIKQNRQQQLKNQSLIYKQFVHAVFNHHSFIFAAWIYCHLKDGCTVKSSIIVP